MSFGTTIFFSDARTGEPETAEPPLDREAASGSSPWGTGPEEVAAGTISLSWRGNPPGPILPRDAVGGPRARWDHPRLDGARGPLQRDGPEHAQSCHSRPSSVTRSLHFSYFVSQPLVRPSSISQTYLRYFLIFPGCRQPLRSTQTWQKSSGTLPSPPRQAKQMGGYRSQTSPEGRVSEGLTGWFLLEFDAEDIVVSFHLC